MLGISNISFGLPAAAREVVNSVFLYYCTKAGLDLAIVNAEKLERFASIPEEERRLAENLLFNTPPAEVADDRCELRTAPGGLARADAGAEGRHQPVPHRRHRRALPQGQRARRRTAPPTCRSTSAWRTTSSRAPRTASSRTSTASAPKGAAPLDIINGPLMAGMAEVGRLFNNNELIVAEVLQSAEAMKAAVNHLEQFMEKADTAARGKILLATVKGDVHDIGKNLVEIILANNGYDVINLGIKVPPEELIQACQEHQPDAIGLSGLLVKSAQQMVITGEDLQDAGIRVPLLVGGAALSREVHPDKIAPAYGAAVCYAKDAMTGLRLHELASWTRPRARPCWPRTPAPKRAPAAEEAPAAPAHASTQRSSKVRTDLPIPPAPYLDRKVRDVPHLAEVWSYINPFMLYGRHLGYKGNFEKNLPEREPKALELFHEVEEVKREAAALHEGARRLAASSKPSATATPSTSSRPAATAPLAHVPLRPAAAAKTASA